MKKRRTITVVDEVWKGIRKAALDAGKTVGDYLVSMHLSVRVDELDWPRIKYDGSEMPNIREVEKLINDQIDEAIAIPKLLGRPFSKDIQLGKKGVK